MEPRIPQAAARRASGLLTSSYWWVLSWALVAVAVGIAWTPPDESTSWTRVLYGLSGAALAAGLTWVVAFAVMCVRLPIEQRNDMARKLTAAEGNVERLTATRVPPDHEQFLKVRVRDVARQIRMHEAADLRDDDGSGRTKDALGSHFPEATVLIEKWNDALVRESGAQRDFRRRLHDEILLLNTPPRFMPFRFDSLSRQMDKTLQELGSNQGLDHPYSIPWVTNEPDGRPRWPGQAGLQIDVFQGEMSDDEQAQAR